MLLSDKNDIYFYRWTDYKGLKEPKKLVWNVMCEDWNSRNIVVFNIFEHGGFFNDLLNIKKEMKQFNLRKKLLRFLKKKLLVL